MDVESASAFRILPVDYHTVCTGVSKGLSIQSTVLERAEQRGRLDRGGPADYNLLRRDIPKGSDTSSKSGAREWRNWQTRET